ncbi:heat shock protein 30C-like isoform X1 [Pristis pectinata]|uniref:heat shock protein 30C-like isoform X1 n=1 Tax=Pristis pectinata TaxID=685728 RepID=UPI00223E16C4|nr:heat shock protein 30C-like isoform X1 [Pristis pectinata]
MLSCRTFLPRRLCQQPVHTLWPLPLTVYEPLGCTAWKQVEGARRSSSFMERVADELAKEFWGDGARIRRQGAAADGGQSGTVGESGDGFSLSLEVPRFSPEELKVKVVGRKVLVTGEHEKKSDDGSGSYSYTREEFRREFQLPEDVDAQAVNCCLSQDGRLKVEAPRLALPPVDERTVPIDIASGTASSPRLHPGEEAQERGSGGVAGIKDEMEAKAEI